MQVASDVSSVSAGVDGGSFMVKRDTNLWATGYNNYGGFGFGNTTQLYTWTQTSMSNVRQVSAGDSHSVVLKNDGTVWVAGRNDLGQLGLGDNSGRSSWTQVTNPNILKNGDNQVVAVAARKLSTYLIKSDGTVWVTGRNLNGQLGLGDTVDRNVWTQAALLNNVTKITGLTYSMFALKSDGTVWATGINNNGALGLGNSLQNNSWVQTGITDVIDIDSSGSHSLALKSNGNLWATGYTGGGSLGFGGLNRLYWVDTGITDVADVATGWEFSMIRKTDGSVSSTGSNSFGQLSNGASVYYKTWQPVSINDAVKVQSSSYGQMQFIFKNNSTLWAAGYNLNGDLGIGDWSNRFSFTASSIVNVTKVTSSYLSSFALKNDNTLWVAGYNGYGQLGIGNNTDKNVWTQSLSGVVDVSSFYLHAIAVKSDGTVWVTGWNGYYQLGLGDTVNRNTWTQVPGITNAIKVSASELGSIIITSTGELWGAGSNSAGQLGLGYSSGGKTTFTKSTSLKVDNISKIWSGSSSTFIQKIDGTVWAVGTNNSGQLGLGDYSVRNDWVQLVNFTGALDISPGVYATFILKADKTLCATGASQYGELALDPNLTYVKRNTFIQIADNVVSASLGINQSIILKEDGKVYTTGRNQIGSLGVAVTNEYLQFGFAKTIDNVKRSNGYYATGTISNLKVDAGAGKVSKWNSVSWQTSALPPNTSVKFRTRGAVTEAGLVDAVWSSYYTASGDNITTSPSRWLEIETTLNTSDGLNTPILDNFSVNYFTDTTIPNNPTVPVSAWNNSGKSVSIANSTDLAPVYKNHNQPYFEFDGATDEVDGSGVAGYYVYFGQSDTADPFTAGTYQIHNGSGAQAFTPAQSITADGPYYLRIKTKDNAANISVAVTAFTYNYDKILPLSPALLSVSPFGWASTNDFSFDWSSGFDEETSYPSGLAGYQYKLGGTVNDWSGTVVYPSDSEMFGDSGEVVNTELLSAVNIKAYQNGQNVFYIRSVDKAGNFGTVKQTNYYFNGDAPSAPQNISVDPQSATANSFTFAWDKPAAFNGDIKGYRYSINNAQPQENNTTFVGLAGLPLTAESGPSYNPTTGQFKLNNIPAATLQHLNYIYVVAVDTSDKVAFGISNIATIGFECITPAPGVPVGVIAFDTSNRDTAEYAVALKWTKPENEGVGFSGYDIYRSIDGTFGDIPIGTSSSTSFIDTGLESIEYFYKVKSKDNSGNFSADSTVVSLTPTGKYTKPPEITIQPEVTAKVSTSSIRWVTDRQATSFVEYGEDANYGAEQGKQGGDKVTDHTVLLLGLKSDTVYYYRVGYSDQDGNTGYSTGGTFKTQPAPRVERVTIQDVRLYTAVLTWYTSEPAISDLVYGKSSNYSTELKNVSGGATTVHSVRLDGLDHSSTYHFAVRITDVDDNQVLSDDYSFDTLQFPKLSNVNFQPMADQSTSTFKVTWDSNVPTTSAVEFRPEGGNVQETVKSKLELKHEIIVSGLLDNTYYLINIVGVDQYGNSVSSDVNRVKTDFDTRPPVLTSPMVEISSSDFGAESKSQIVVSWETDEPSTSQIEYGIGVSGNNYDNRSQEDANMTTSHVVIVTGLLPSSSYHIRAVSRDESDNKGVSESESILTEQAKSSVLDIILGSLQASLGWLLGLRN